MPNYQHEIGRITGHGRTRREAVADAEGLIATEYERVMSALQQRPIVHSYRGWLGLVYFDGYRWGWIVTTEGGAASDSRQFNQLVGMSIERCCFHSCQSRDNARGQMLYNLAQLGYSNNDGVSCPAWIPSGLRGNLETWQAWQQAYACARRNGFSDERARNIANGFPPDGPTAA